MIGTLAILLALPLVVFLSGVWLMSEMSDRKYVITRLKTSDLPECEKKPINQRFGYDLKAVARYWGAFDDRALAAEQYFLELDLVFPFFYGAALAIILLSAWALLGRSFSPLWIIAPIAVIVLADWTENLVHMHQMKHYRMRGEAALQPNMIHIASVATSIKIIFFCALILFLVGLAAMVLVRSLRST